MTILEWLVPSMNKLVKAGVDSPRRDCLVLIEDLLGKDRSWVTAHAEFELSDDQVLLLDKRLARRVKREPLAYIRGKAWFYNRLFKVTPDVMIPRPESESFIELLKDLKPDKIIDIGTGSGCLAITSKLELPGAQVIAADIDKNALEVAQKNAAKHTVDIKFVQSSLFNKLQHTDFTQAAIAANLPYVPEGLVTSEEINFEPAIALFSGKDGLDHYRDFWSQVHTLDKKPGYILTESLENQHGFITSLASKAGYELTKTDTLVQLFKLVQL
jgi:release factor glutamine methyltransferase